MAAISKLFDFCAKFAFGKSNWNALVIPLKCRKLNIKANIWNESAFWKSLAEICILKPRLTRTENQWTPAIYRHSQQRPKLARLQITSGRCKVWLQRVRIQRAFVLQLSFSFGPQNDIRAKFGGGQKGGKPANEEKYSARKSVLLSGSKVVINNTRVVAKKFGG